MQAAYYLLAFVTQYSAHDAVANPASCEPSWFAHCSTLKGCASIGSGKLPIFCISIVPILFLTCLFAMIYST
jgi:hypothetical protein